MPFLENLPCALKGALEFMYYRIVDGLAVGAMVEIVPRDSWPPLGGLNAGR